MELFENLGKTINNISNDLSELQTKFMESTLYKSVNRGVDFGIRVLLPNFIEDEVISLKDSIMENGLIQGVKEAVGLAIDFGKNIYRITTKNFNSIEQMENVLDKSGTISKISDFLDSAIDTVKSMGFIDNNVKTILKSGKNAILNNIKNNISDEFSEQSKYLKHAEKYADKWQGAYEARDLKEMNKAFDKLEECIEETVPLEETMKIYNEIKTLHELIENNGGNFDLSQNELELIEALSY